MKNNLLLPPSFIHTYSSYMKEKFGCRVYKVSIDGGFTCPNRDGIKSSSGCIYCDTRGSSSRTHLPSTPISIQVQKNIAHRKERYKAQKFIVYFQSFSNTYASREILKERYDEAIHSDPDIIGLSIATRADCINEEKIALIASYQKFLPYVNIELGLQSIHNKTLQFLNRGEYFEDFLKALFLIKKYHLHHTIHVILDLPGETQKEQLQTAKKLAELDIEGIKIHLLVALKNTALETLYHKGRWKPMSFDEHISLICDFLEYLPPSCIIHRISGNGHPHLIVAPTWIIERKEEILPSIQQEFIKRNSHQGSRY